MLRSYLLALLAVFSLLFSSASWALPFTVVVKAGTQLPTQVQLGSTTTAYYTVFNNQASQRNNNFVKHLPPNVTQATTGTFPNTCGRLFNLAPKGRPGDSCTLQLTISGPVSPSLPPDLHLFVCFPGGKTCAGTAQPLNVIQTFPVSIAITPVSASIDSQNTQQYTAIGTFADGLTINVTPLLNWASSNKAVATISSSGLATGTTGSAGGTTTITASINGVTSNPATLNVAGVLILTATPSTNTEVGAVYTQTNVAHGGFTPYSYSVASGGVPTGTTLNPATGTVSGTPSAAGTFNYTIRVTDPQGKTATASTSVTIAAAVTIAATPSAFTQVGIAYSQTNVASNGITPYVYSVSAGALPAGTTLNTATGTVSGTPTAAGAFSYTITVTDSNGQTASVLTSGNMVAVLALVATQSTNTEVGAVYSQINTVSGGTAPYTYTLSAGALPAGTALSPTTGNVAGTPTAAGPFSYTITVTDNIGATASASSSGTIAATVTIAATPSPATQIGVPYSQTNVASNGVTPYLYSVAAGTLPTGTTLNTTTGTVAGTPTGGGGTFNYTIQVTDHDGQTASVATTVTIAAAITLTATPSAFTEVGAAYSQLNTVGGGTAPYTYTLSAGTLPTGTSLSATTGTVAGTPTAPGTFTYTIQVTDANSKTATAPTTVIIAAAISLAATPSTHTEVGVAYSQVNTVSGGTAAYTYTLASGALPAGTTLSSSTGTVSGTPTGSGGLFNYTIQVTDSFGQTATATTSGTINPVLGLTATPSINTEVGATYSQANTVSGGLAPYTYTLASGALPAGTTLSATTGTVSGTPTTPGGFTYTIRVTDSDGGTATAATTGTIAAGLALTATPSTFAEVGAVYSQANTVSGGTAPYTYSLFGGTLPNGTSLNTSTGTVSGVPTVGGPFSYTIAVTDLAGITATAVTNVTITGGVSLTATPSTDTVVGRAYSQTNVASGGTAPYAYSLFAGALPAGTSLNTATGTVSGTPTGTGGPISYTIQVTDHNGATATAATSGTMAGLIALTATPSTFRGVGAPYSQLNTVSGGKAPFTYSVSAGA
ncbi:MAG: Ig domain-containing protein, partial [Pseudomonadota bacterium]